MIVDVNVEDTIKDASEDVSSDEPVEFHIMKDSVLRELIGEGSELIATIVLGIADAKMLEYVVCATLVEVVPALIDKLTEEIEDDKSDKLKVVPVAAAAEDVDRGSELPDWVSADEVETEFGGMYNVVKEPDPVKSVEGSVVLVCSLGPERLVF